MIFKTIVLFGLLGSNVAATNLRAHVDAVEETDVESLDLEIMGESGERELFPLLPGTKCPTGHTCRVRTTGTASARPGMSPMGSSLKKSLIQPLAMSMDWDSFNHDMKTVVVSDDYCTRRAAMARAAALAGGVSLTVANQPAFAAETKEVKMGADSGLLVFDPAKLKICKGDSVKWINNKAGPHNVVFDEEGIPSGVDYEKISMIDEQLGEEGESFTRSFDTPGEYAYYCEPHRGAGMNGVLTVA